MRHVHCCTLLCAQGAGCAASACARRAALATACCCMAVRTTACKTGLVIATLVRCGGGRSKVYKASLAQPIRAGGIAFAQPGLLLPTGFAVCALCLARATRRPAYRTVRCSQSCVSSPGTSLHSSTRWRGRVCKAAVAMRTYFVRQPPRAHNANLRAKVCSRNWPRRLGSCIVGEAGAPVTRGCLLRGCFV